MCVHIDTRLQGGGGGGEQKAKQNIECAFGTHVKCVFLRFAEIWWVRALFIESVSMEFNKKKF